MVEGAGLEGTFHCSADRDMVPVLSGGGFLTTLDFCRYALLFARMGVGVRGESIGNAEWMQMTLENRGTLTDKGFGTYSRMEGARYSNSTTVYKGCFAHAGYGGQFFLADPQSQTVCVFFSVLETPDACDVESGTYWENMTDMMFEVIQQQRDLID
jgi:CubicO group peptidase (beta-lactamase class C family)